jgi:hypothetical protein
MRPGMRCPAILLVVCVALGGFTWIAGALAQTSQGPVVEAVEAVGVTVADLESQRRRAPGLLL